jgi:hypothetical protein
MRRTHRRSGRGIRREMGGKNWLFESNINLKIEKNQAYRKCERIRKKDEISREAKK